MDEATLNGLSVLQDLTINDIVADTAEIGVLTANVITAGIQNYSTTQTNDITVNNSALINILNASNLTILEQGTAAKNFSVGGNLYISSTVYSEFGDIDDTLTVRSRLIVPTNATAEINNIIINSGIASFLRVSNLEAVNLSISGLNVSTLDNLTIRQRLTVSGSCIINSGLTVGNGIAGGVVYDPNQVVGYFTTSSLETNFVVHNTAVSGGKATYNLTANSNFWDITANALDDKLIFYDELNDKSGMWLQRYNDGADLYVSRSLLAVGGRFTNLSATNLTADNITFPTDLTFTDLTVRSLVATAQADFQNVSSPGYSIITSGSIVCGNRMDVRGSSFLVSGTATIGSGLHISGNATVASALTVSGAVSLASTIEIMGEMTLNSILNVSGQTTLASSLYIEGAVSIASSLLITGATTAYGAMNLLGNATISEILTVEGKNPSFDYEARVNLYSNGNTNAIVSYDTGAMEILNNNTLTISGQTDLLNTLTVKNGRLIEEISNSNDYSLLQLKNDNSNGLVAFVNGSTKTSDGGAGVGNIRMDNSNDLRVQNYNYFQYNSGVSIAGDPTGFITQGTNSSNQFVVKAAVCDNSVAHDFLYITGHYTTNTLTMIKNLDGTTSSHSLPSTAGVKTVFIIQYSNETGQVGNVWHIPGLVSSEGLGLYASTYTTRLFLVGSYRSTAIANIPDLSGIASAYNLPNSAGFDAGFFVAFDTNNYNYNVCNFTFLNGRNASGSQNNYFSSVEEDIYGNVFIAGSVLFNVGATIFDLLGNTTGQTMPLNNLITGFILRYDNSATGFLTGRWVSNSFTCHIGNTAIKGNTLYLAGYLTTGGSDWTIPHWNGAGNSAFILKGPEVNYSNGYGNSFLIKFTGIYSIASPTVVGRANQSNENLAHTEYFKSIVCYNPVLDKIYWAGTTIATYFYRRYHNYLTDANYTAEWTPPMDNGGAFSSTRGHGFHIMIYEPDTNQIYGLPMYIWSFNKGAWNQTDNIHSIRANHINGNTYIQFGLYSNRQPKFMGNYEVGSNIVEFPNAAPNLFNTSYSLCMNLNIPRGLHYIPYNWGNSYCADVAISSSVLNKIFVCHTINNSVGWPIQNYDSYNSAYSMPATSTFNAMAILPMTTLLLHNNYYSSRGIGIGRQHSGLFDCSIEAEKGIFTNTKVICKEIQSTSATNTVKFTDSVGRENQSAAKAWVNINGVRNSIMPVIQNAVNVRYITKTANGYYNVFFSNPAPNDYYAILVSSTGYNFNNYTIFPFISTADIATNPIGTAAYKDIYGYRISVNQTGGAGFDVSECSTVAFW